MGFKELLNRNERIGRGSESGVAGGTEKGGAGAMDETSWPTRLWTATTNNYQATRRRYLPIQLSELVHESSGVHPALVDVRPGALRIV